MGDADGADHHLAGVAPARVDRQPGEPRRHRRTAVPAGHGPGSQERHPRTTALLCIPYGDGYIVTGSNWGRPEHPTWSVNLRAANEARVKAGSHESRMSVRMVTGDERENLWKLVIDYWPGYLMEHRRSGGREFRLFVLEPAQPSTEIRES